MCKPMNKLNLLKTIIVSLVVLSVFLITGHPAIAQKQTPEPTTSAKPAVVQYDLAYPGILPDHPLYKLKVLRDKISEALISDPLKKIEFYLLQADKGILATAILVDKNKIELAQQTVLKAENNYTLLAGELNNLPRKPSKSLFDKLETANLKHQEVLIRLAERVSEDKRKTFNQVIDFAKSNLQTVKAYKNN